MELTFLGKKIAISILEKNRDIDLKHCNSTNNYNFSGSLPSLVTLHAFPDSSQILNLSLTYIMLVAFYEIEKNSGSIL